MDTLRHQHNKDLEFNVVSLNFSTALNVMESNLKILWHTDLDCFPASGSIYCTSMKQAILFGAAHFAKLKIHSQGHNTTRVIQPITLPCLVLYYWSGLISSRQGSVNGQNVPVAVERDSEKLCVVAFNMKPECEELQREDRDKCLEHP